VIGTVFIDKHQTRLLGAVLVIAAALRLAGLGGLPPFIDESGHVAFLNPIHPTFFQLGKILGQFVFRLASGLSSDTLYALRLVIALFGVLTTFGVFLTGRLLGGTGAGLLSGLIWAILPIVTFHDRLALHDPMISLFHVWSIYLLLIAMQSNDLRIAAGAGLLSGLAALVKIPLFPLAAGCLLLGFIRIPKDGWGEKKNLAFGFAGGFLAAMLILLPNAGMLFGGNIYQETGIGAGASSVSRLFTNLGRVYSWLAGYNSVGFVLAAAACAWLAIRGHDPLRKILLGLFAVPVFGMSLLLNAFFARYLLVTLIPLTFLMALTAADILFPAQEEVVHE
jgi:4-amino-4-deoxy-L-arabinose transferase-like glycosyltransferase